jgi:hypothetical protein
MSAALPVARDSKFGRLIFTAVREFVEVDARVFFALIGLVL